MFSPDVTLISASAAPYCGAKLMGFVVVVVYFLFSFVVVFCAATKAFKDMSCENNHY